MTDKQHIDLDTIKQAIDERDAATGKLEALAQRLEYRGNSVSWWHSKATAYGDALIKSWDVLKAAGVKCDGETSVADGIARLTAEVKESRRCEMEAYAVSERLKELLWKMRERTQNLLHRQHGDQIIMNPDDYLRATLSWLDAALGAGEEGK